MFIDSHCHLDCLDLVSYNNDRAVFLKSQRDDGIDHMLCVSISLDKFGEMTKFFDGEGLVSFSVGLHPNESCVSEPKEEGIIRLAAMEGVIAIGETGLDYFHETIGKDIQAARFRTHIRAAKELKRPLIIHSRDAIEDIIRILEEEGADEVGGVFHCFTENWEVASRIIDMGFYISFSGIVTFKNAVSIQDVAKKIPADKFLIETDSPYLAPAPHRGRQNYPSYVRHVAQFISNLRSVSLEEIAYNSSRNFCTLFGLPT